MTEELAAINWLLRHSVHRVEVGYTMTSADTADEWVKLTQVGQMGEKSKSITIDHHLARRILDFRPEFPRSIARLKSPIEARRLKEQHDAETERRERRQLKRLQEKYGAAQGDKHE